ncbi:hypothetical protein ParKJ_23315 [Paraburkholderia fungorum]|uniref:Uncharacterized protein n=1 Tax=Paraburkholderia fungorum TaxID=134537 RepID=A0AAP5UVI3_9BURK|nr:hypothetical protein [Paraburkholderia fungorum]MDT8840358.1 hypothetical protein [Paraburkholderia fungorum]
MQNQQMPADLQAALVSIYEEIMWLSSRPNVTSGRARAWYTHIMAESVKRRIRQFTGLVSRSAIAAEGTGLRLEHYKRIQTTLTALVDRHRRDQLNDPGEFVRTLVDYESVHIVTTEENYAAMKAQGDYDKAGIVLTPWIDISADRRETLWRKMLRGKVANAERYRELNAAS